MTVEQAVRDRLLASPSVTALVAQRVYQLVLPQKPTLPAIRVQLVDEPTTHHLRGVDGSRASLVQVDAFVAESSGYGTCVALADAIDAALNGAQFNGAGSPAVTVRGAFRGGRTPFHVSGELRQVRIMQDYTVVHEAVN